MHCLRNCLLAAAHSAPPSAPPEPLRRDALGAISVPKDVEPVLAKSGKNIKDVVLKVYDAYYTAAKGPRGPFEELLAERGEALGAARPQGGARLLRRQAWRWGGLFEWLLEGLLVG